MSENGPKTPKFGLLYAILLPVLVVPVAVILFLAIRGDEAEQYYRRGMDASLAGDAENAMEYFRQAGARGHAEACCTLGMIYLYGMDCEADMETARDYFELAALYGSIPAEYELGRMAEHASGGADYALAALHYNRAALGGNTEAMLALARLYETGSGVNLSPVLAESFYRKAVASGSVEAECALAELYIAGLPQPGREDEAFDLLTRAAASDNPRGYCGLGYMYEHGWSGHPADLAQARRNYRIAAKLGDRAAMINLGDLLRETDPAESLALYRRAAKLNYAPAWHRLGLRFFNGEEEGKPNYQAAKDCFEQAARGGYAASWINLGIMYELGRGIAPDREKAEKCYRQALKMGHAEAEKRLRALAENTASADAGNAVR